jgi:hypothetical protein
MKGSKNKLKKVNWMLGVECWLFDVRPLLRRSIELRLQIQSGNRPLALGTAYGRLSRITPMNTVERVRTTKNAKILLFELFASFRGHLPHHASLFYNEIATPTLIC